MAEPILEIIKNMPEDRKLFCTIIGNTKVSIAEGDEYPIKTLAGGESIAEDGRYFKSHKGAECILFPSKDCRDWDKWALVLVEDGDLVLHKSGRVVRFDHRSHDYDDIVRFASAEELAEQEKKDASVHVTQAVEPFKPFGRVLVCNSKKERLIPRLFSQKIGELFYCQDGKSYKFCIPYDGNESAQYIV